MELQKSKRKEKKKSKLLALKFRKKVVLFCFVFLYFVELFFVSVSFCFLSFFSNLHHLLPLNSVDTHCVIVFSLSSCICSMVLLHILVVENNQNEIIF